MLSARFLHKALDILAGRSMSPSPETAARLTGALAAVWLGFIFVALFIFRKPLFLFLSSL